MAVTVITEASRKQMTTVAAVKEAMGITVDKWDGLIDRLINAATKALQEYSGHIFAKQTYQETLPGSDYPYLLLSITPISSVATVLYDSEPVTDFVIADARLGQLYRQVGWAQKAWVGWFIEPRQIPGTEEMNVTVTYDAGYLMPGDKDRDLPFEYEEACIRTVQSWMRKDQRGGEDVKSRKVGDLQVEYHDPKDSPLALPSDARALVGRNPL